MLKIKNAGWDNYDHFQMRSIVDHGGNGDGTTDNYIAFTDIEASVYVAYVIPAGTYLVESNITLTKKVIMLPGAKIKPASGVKITFNGFYIAPIDGSGLDKSAGGDFYLAPVSLTVGSGQQFETVQEAVDYVPRSLHQWCVIGLTDGTYDEDVRIDGIHASYMEPDVSSGYESPRLVLTGTDARDPNVILGSVVITGCLGGTGHPSVQNLSLTRANPYTNESCALEAYGSHGVTTTELNFSNCTAQRAIQSYDSTITASYGHDFGINQVDYAYGVKHGGVIYCNTSAGADTGTVNERVYRLQNGTIYTYDMTEVAASKEQMVFFDAVGMLVDNLTGRVYTATEGAQTGDFSYTEMFTSFDNWTNTSGTGGTLTIGSDGAKLTANNTGGTTAEFTLNRNTFTNNFLWANFRTTVSNANTAINATGTLYVVMGKLSGSYIGVKYYNDGSNNAVYGVVKDGTNPEQSVKLANITGNGISPVEVIIRGNKVRFYRFGSHVGTITLATTMANLSGTILHLKNTTSGTGNSVFDIDFLQIIQ